jgi:hypothetical protein
MSNLTALRTAFVLAIALSAVTANAQSVTLPRPSPAATAEQTIGISTVKVNYSRPAVKGREIWGKQVPYGYNKQGFGLGNDAPWRAGANENTVITFTNDATVEGHSVPAGSYGLFFVINQDNTGEVILSKDYRSWGSFFYDPKNDLMRAKIQPRPVQMTELLTYDFINVSKSNAEMVLNWEKLQFPVKISFDADNIVMANAEQQLKSTTGFGYLGFVSAANYALTNKLTAYYDESLIWIDKAINVNRTFTTLSVKSNLLKETGKTAEADKTMSEALTVANEGEINAYGYQLLAAKDNDRAIDVLMINTQRFPKSANTWDSLGEAYATKGGKKNAIASFKKSLTLNPPAATKANSEKYLAQLGSN